MAKLYTLDEKLLTECPEIRIGETRYPVDCRQKTVKKMLQLVQRTDKENAVEIVDQALALALGDKAYQDLDARNLPYAAYQQLLTLVVEAATGADETEAARFSDKREGSVL